MADWLALVERRRVGRGNPAAGAPPGPPALIAGFDRLRITCRGSSAGATVAIRQSSPTTPVANYCRRIMTASLLLSDRCIWSVRKDDASHIS